jgi:hypothetical protein
VKESWAVTAARSLPQIPLIVVSIRTQSGPGSTGGSISSSETHPSLDTGKDDRPDPNQRVRQGELLAALLAYRAMYYLAPLAIACLLYLLMDLRAPRQAKD